MSGKIMDRLEIDPKRGLVNHVKVKTDGTATPGLLFQGETMVCAICGEIKVSDPAVESGWRCIYINGLPGFKLYYCTRHDNQAQATHFKEALSAEISRRNSLTGAPC